MNERPHHPLTRRLRKAEHKIRDNKFFTKLGEIAGRMWNHRDITLIGPDFYIPRDFTYDMREDHVLSERCWCVPKVETDIHGTLIIHRDLLDRTVKDPFAD